MPIPLSTSMNYNEFTDILRSKTKEAKMINDCIKVNKELKLEDMENYTNINQKDKRNYIAIRVFSEKFKNDI